MQKLCTEDGAENSAGAGDSVASNMANVVSCVREYTQPIRREEELLIQQQEMIKRQDALRPVFLNLMRGPRKERERAYSLRRHLVDANIDMASITEAWNAGQKDAVGKLLEEKVRTLFFLLIVLCNVAFKEFEISFTLLVTPTLSLLQALISDEKDREELITRVEWHFVPESRPKIERRPSYPKRGRRLSRNADKTNGNCSF